MAVKSKQPAKPKTANPVMGRPRAEINFDAFEGLCRLFCTLSEIAGFLKVSEDTVERRCVEHYGETFADTYKRVSAGGKVSLRRAQFKAAEAGNPTMLIWLGKQTLGQSDRTEVAATNLNINLDDLTDNELERIANGESAAAVVADRARQSTSTAGSA